MGLMMTLVLSLVSIQNKNKNVGFFFRELEKYESIFTFTFVSTLKYYI